MQIIGFQNVSYLIYLILVVVAISVKLCFPLLVLIVEIMDGHSTIYLGLLRVYSDFEILGLNILEPIGINFGSGTIRVQITRLNYFQIFKIYIYFKFFKI